MTSDRTILITGVTGHQGGAVAQALNASGFRVRGLTRKPESEHATALEREFGRALTRLPGWARGQTREELV